MTWNVLPHGPLESLNGRLWRVQGTLANMPLPRNMVLWKADDGSLVVHSPVSANDEVMAQIEALGPIRTIIVPCRNHRLDAPAWGERFQEAKIVCPEAVLAPVQAVVRVDDTEQSALSALGATVYAPPGLKDAELVLEVPVEGGKALIFTDQVFHLREHLGGVGGFMMRYVTRSSGFFGISGLGRLLLLRDRRPFAAWLREQAERTDLVALTMCHGEPVLGDAIPGHLREAADRLA